jgi:hypothetical protein
LRKERRSLRVAALPWARRRPGHWPGDRKLDDDWRVALGVPPPWLDYDLLNGRLYDWNCAHPETSAPVGTPEPSLVRG